MGYLEDVYDRWESTGFSASWLRGFNNRPPNNIFEEKGIELYDQYQLLNEAKKTSNISRLTEIKTLIGATGDSPLKNETIVAIEEKLDTEKEQNRIKSELNSTDDYDKLRNLRRDADKISDPQLVDLVEKKMDKVNKELERLSNERKAERLEQEAIEEKKAKELIRLQSEDRRKAANAKRTLDKMRERGEIQ